MYQALYRKWRPKIFADVIGQDGITGNLRRQTAEGRTSHAYLFTGTRGTGKTTCAKILAKAVNCEDPQDGDPCCRCPSCLGIESGSFTDVTELDAASNNGVDHVRALREEAVYAPAYGKKRVYIIDEVHMLSGPAFNALLKILEEPPEHLLFILATTELHKVPATILSRCQRYAFKRILPGDIQKRLSYVAAQEGIQLTEDGAELLARLADGALRDALSLLDQCAVPGGTVDSDAVLEVLGLAGNFQTASLLEHVLNRDAPSALTMLDRLYNDGKDVGALLGELSVLVRDLLVRQTAPDRGDVLLSGAYDRSTLDRLGSLAGRERLICLANTLQRASADLFYSTDRRIDAELCLLRLCDESLSGDLTALTSRIHRLEEALERGGGIPSPKTAGAGSAAASRSPAGAKPVPANAPSGRDMADVPRSGKSPSPPERTAPRYGAEDEERPPLPEEAPPPPEKMGERVYDVPDFISEEDERQPGAGTESAPEAGTETRLGNRTGAGPKVGMGSDPEGERKAETGSNPETEADANPETGPAPSETAADPGTGSAIPNRTAAAAIPAGEDSPAELASDAAWWRDLAERCKGQLSPMYRAFLDMCFGVKAGDLLTVYGPDEVTLGRLDNDRVRGVLLEESGAVRLTFQTGDPPRGSAEDNFKSLMKFGSRFDNIKIKGSRD